MAQCFLETKCVFMMMVVVTRWTSIHFSIKTKANLASAEFGLGVLVSIHFSIKTDANLPSAESGLRVLGFYLLFN